ncbi:MAG: hypothetical protein JW874_12430 [Spirochaetales bacterium]|nr:hypothetical protein [Spirochaetales bacterium]
MEGYIPGNLLLFGEYAVLEECGLGICAAVKPLVHWKLTDNGKISGSYAGQQEVFDPARKSGASNSLPGCCWQQCSEYAARQGFTLKPQGIHIDSERFFAAGRKSGFGSSAAVAVACVRAILGFLPGGGPESAMVSEIAFEAHSTFQGKTGSGYDIYTSNSTGINVFSRENGRSLKKAELAWLGGLYCFAGEKPVSSSAAVKAYQNWKSTEPQQAGHFLEKSNSNIRRLLAACKWDDACDIIGACRELQSWLGRKIGISAELPASGPVGENNAVRLKASGAGNELILVFSRNKLGISDALEEIEIYHGGPR